jgi:phosphoserine phosphatase
MNPFNDNLASIDLIIQADDIETSALKELHGISGAIGNISKLSDTTLGYAFRIGNVQTDFSNATNRIQNTVAEFCASEKLDFAFFPSQQHLSNYKLAAFDMDSTLISIECIDEIADFAGVKPEVAAITEAAMRGELDYPASLIKRVALLEGLNENVLEEVYRQRLKLNAGCERLIKALAAAGVHLMVVSGGFTFFTNRIKERLSFQHAYSNVLEVRDGKLTGKLASDIFDGECKRRELLRVACEMGLEREQLIAVGDGANDLPMMGEAGLSMAYHAKPKVQAQARISINHMGLDALLPLFDFGN